MLVTYRPEGQPEQAWEFDPGRVRAAEAELVEKRAGQHWAQWVSAVQSGSIRARRILLWHLLKQVHHTLRFEDTPDFYADEVGVEYGVGELRRLRDRLLKANLTADELEQAMTAVDIQITEALEREADGGEVEGKAPSASVESASG